MSTTINSTSVLTIPKLPSEICLSSATLPTFNGIYSLIAPALIYPPPFKIILPTLPTMPSPLFATLYSQNLELAKFAVEAQTALLLTTCKAIIDPLLAIVGGALPKIPVINLDLVDLLSLNPQVLIEKVKQAVLAKVPFPYVTIPFYLTLNIPEFQYMQIASLIVKNYLISLMLFIQELVSKVADILKFDELGIPLLPTLPQIPTLDELLAQATALIPPLPNVSLNEYRALLFEALSKLSVPGFPPLPGIPNPLIPSLSIIEYELQESLGILMNHLTLLPMNIILEYTLEQLTKVLSFVFPVVCFPITSS